MYKYNKVDKMTRRGSRTERQFSHWHALRNGSTQAEVARLNGVTRQAVNKGVKLHERDVVLRLLDTARSIGVLVEWYDQKRGALIGISPQLGNLSCIMLIDDENEVRVFYDPKSARDREVRRRTIKEMTEVVRDAFGLRLSTKLKFREVLDEIIEKG